jgi:hypothetical protein
MAAEACFVRLQYRLDAEAVVWPATLARVSKEVQLNVVEQFVDRWPQGSENRRLWLPELSIAVAQPSATAADFPV